jgi:hypothetical protein
MYQNSPSVLFALPFLDQINFLFGGGICAFRVETAPKIFKCLEIRDSIKALVISDIFPTGSSPYDAVWGWENTVYGTQTGRVILEQLILHSIKIPVFQIFYLKPHAFIMTDFHYEGFGAGTNLMSLAKIIKNVTIKP